MAGDAETTGEILKQLRDLATTIVRLEEQLKHITDLQPEVHQATQNIAVVNQRVSDIQSRLDRAETNARWSFGIAITAMVSVIGFIVTWLSAKH